MLYSQHGDEKDSIQRPLARRLGFAVILGCFLLPQLIACSPATLKQAREPRYDLLATLRYIPELSRFAQLVDQAGMMMFFQTAQNLTVFAPSNAAIAELPAHLQRYYFSDDPQSRRRLRRQIQYTIAPFVLYTKDMREGKISTVHGSKAYLQPLPNGGFHIDRARAVQTDIPARNGVIHIIDRFNLSNSWK